MFERFRRGGDSAGGSSPDDGAGAVSAQQVRSAEHDRQTTVAERDDTRSTEDDSPTTVATRDDTRPTEDDSPTTVATRDDTRPTEDDSPTTVATRDDTRATEDDSPTTVAARDAGAEPRFTRERGDGDATGSATADGPARERRRLGEVDRDRDAVDDRDERGSTRTGRSPLIAGETMAAVRARQREHFGGINWGSAFFGFLTALGLASLLTAILAAAGVALGLFDQATGSDASASDTQTIGLGGGIALLVALAVAWYCGGYVAGRMARFDGARQGLAVWAWTIAAVVVIGALAAVGGSKYDVFQNLNLPSLPINGSTLTRDGAIAGAAAVLVTLLVALLGGKTGERYHRRVDRVAHEHVEA